jgi:hypothetical protein
MEDLIKLMESHTALNIRQSGHKIRVVGCGLLYRLLEQR